MSLDHAAPDENTQPIFDPATHYRLVVRGRVDIDWLHSFDGLAEILVDAAGQMEAFTVLSAHTDQAGIVGLVRRLHGLGLTIQQFQIVQNDG
jgi:hypothetical protein